MKTDLTKSLKLIQQGCDSPHPSEIEKIQYMGECNLQDYKLHVFAARTSDNTEVFAMEEDYIDTYFCNVKTFEERVTQELAALENGSPVRVWGKGVHEIYRGVAVLPLIKKNGGYNVAYVDANGNSWGFFNVNGRSGGNAFITPAYWTMRDVAELEKEYLRKE